MKSTANDLALITQVAVFGNKRAFDALIRKYQSQVRRFLLGLTLGDSQLADDLAQDTFIKAYSNIGKFCGMSAFSTWLMRIAYNTHYDYRRSHHPTADIDSTPPDTMVHTQDGGCAFSIDIIKALAVLNTEERSCIILQLIDGQSIDRIASITGMPQGSVKSCLHRGKQKLRTFLKNNGYER